MIEGSLDRYSAKERVPRYSTYWFIDHPGRTGDPMKVAPCKETGHRFDAENFAKGNYYLTRETAKIVMDIQNARREARENYLLGLKQFKQMTPKDKEKAITRMMRKMMLEELNETQKTK